VFSRQTILVLLTALLALGAGCGTSSEEFVLSGSAKKAAVRDANDVVLAVVAPGNVHGAQAVVDASVGSPSAQATPNDFTIPGALCTAYDEAGHTVSTVVVDSRGNARFDRLPTGVYRFVVTNQDAAVVLQAMTGSNPRGPTFVTASATSTVATLVTVAFGYGLDLPTYADVLQADPVDLIAMIKTELADSGDGWVTADGKTIVDPAINKAVGEFMKAMAAGDTPSPSGTPAGPDEVTPTPTPSPGAEATPQTMDSPGLDTRFGP
jgi:hypothetical protein